MRRHNHRIKRVNEEIFPEEDKRLPWWFRRLPKGLQMLIALRELEKLLKDEELPSKIEQMGQHMERSRRILQGKDDGSRRNERDED